ncbi:MAG TPA: rhodanese-like domain-containing protein, partial [Gammaproteobacteria bacterium]|nr:rhodanese-like domain-containing protein [Gammaproteobacteria bacterium]
ARDHGKGFEGELTPEEAFAVLEKLPNAQLVDVRTQAERDFVGYPKLGTHVEWESYPGMDYNPDFPAQIQAEVGNDTEQVLVFMCRSGGRSGKAAEAMTQQGYPHCYNLLQGFEGDKDERGHRGSKGGWKAQGLSWEQK